MHQQKNLANISFRHAVFEESKEIFTLYRSLVGSPFCAWDDQYPSLQNIEEDLNDQSLFTVHDGQEIVAVATAKHCAEHDNIVPWLSKYPCDLMRIGVKKNRQNHGIGKWLLQKIIETTQNSGFDAIRILVAKNNSPAIKLYLKFNTAYRGETSSYGINWNCYELIYKNKQE